MTRIEKVMATIRGVTDKYVTIECVFNTNTTDYKEPARKMEDVRCKWKLYIADITGRRTGNAFPEFSTFEALEGFVNILCLELKRADVTVVERAVEVAIQICTEKGESQ